MWGSASIKVRPLKMALLVDPNSATQVREAIRLACSLWGGTFFPIIPLHKTTPARWRERGASMPAAPALLSGYLEAFDADMLVQFGAGLPGYLLDTPRKVLLPESFWNQGKAQLAIHPSHGIGVMDLLTDILSRCQALGQEDQRRATVPVIPKRLSLFWAGVVGDYPAHLAEAMAGKFERSLDRPLVKSPADLCRELMEGQTLFPSRIAQWATRLQGGNEHLLNACIIFMDASKVEDVIDFWNLRASGQQVLPLPQQFIHEPRYRELVAEFAIFHHSRWSDCYGFEGVKLVRSRHSRPEAMREFVRSLAPPSSGRGPGSVVHLFSLEQTYPRLWENQSRSQDPGVAGVYGEYEETLSLEDEDPRSIRLKSFVPLFDRKHSAPSHGRCVNEIQLRIRGGEALLAEVYPKGAGAQVQRSLAHSPAVRGEWRIGHRDLVRIVSRTRVEPWGIPESERLFFAWLKDQGWDAKLTSAGVLAQQIHQRLGGRLAVLASKDVLAWVEHMNGDGSARIRAQRAVTAAMAQAQLGTARWASLVHHGMLSPGFPARCPLCRKISWFDRSTPPDAQICPLCLTALPAGDHIDQTPGDATYQMVHPFSVANYADGAFPTLLTIAALTGPISTGRRSSAVPGFEATAPGQQRLAADLAMFWREGVEAGNAEGILFGACTSYQPFKPSDWRRMRHLAENFPGAILVFSTLRESLTPPEIAALSRLASFGRRYWLAGRPVNPVLILTGIELLNWKRAPDCWDEKWREQFKLVRSLLVHCDASQQIYLGLPSWHWDLGAMLSAPAPRRRHRALRPR